MFQNGLLTLPSVGDVVPGCEASYLSAYNAHSLVQSRVVDYQENLGSSGPGTIAYKAPQECSSKNFQFAMCKPVTHLEKVLFDLAAS